MPRIGRLPSSALIALLLIVACDRAIDRIVGPAEPVASLAQRNTALGAGDVRTVLGPRLFARTTGTPATESVTLEGYAPDATLRIANGDANGRFRVTSGTVLVDGQEIVHPSDFGQQVGSITVPIKLRNMSIISVRLAGTPGDQLTLFVDGRPSTAAVVSATGGIIHLLGNQVTLSVPAGSVSGSVELTAAPAPTPSPGAVPGTSIDMGPNGTVFSSPVTLSIAFDLAGLPPGVRPAALRMNWWNIDHWDQLPGNSVDLQRGVVSATTTHFTEFALLPNEVVFCPGDASAESDLRTAITHVPSGGTVFVCDGTHAVAQVLIDKPMTLRSLNAGGATLADAESGGNSQAGTPILRIDGVASGLVRITDIGVEVTDQGIGPAGTFDKVEIDNVRFSGIPGGQGVAVKIESTPVSGARVNVTDSEFTGLYMGVWPVGAVETNIRTSQFDRFGWGGVVYSHGSTAVTQSFGRSEDNVFTNCGSGGCLRVLTAGAVVVARNRFEAMDQSVLTGAITVSTGVAYPNAAPTVIEDNLIISRRTGSPETSPAGWMFQSGISLTDPMVRTAVVRRNRVTDVYSGVTSTASVSVTDNLFTGGVYAIRQTAMREVTFQRNDVTGLLGSFTSPLPGSNFQCNWWGSTAGPTAPPTGTQWAYTPWANEPIAGTSVACTPGAVPPVPPVATITVSPFPIAVLPGGVQRFSATGRAANGGVVPTTPVWSITNGGGTINSDGLFTAGTVSGTFVNTVRATSGSVSGAVTLAVGEVASVVVLPNPAPVVVGATQQFYASARDVNGYQINMPTSAVWTVANGGGSISAGGVFTAGSTTGTFASSVTATFGTVSGTATVIVTPPLVPEVRLCGTAGDGVTVPTFAEAYARVVAGGTVRICDGTFVVSNFTISKPVTITAEGPVMPTLDAGGGTQVFRIAGVSSGTVTISKLRFTGGSLQQVMVSSGNAATIMIADNEFLATESHPYSPSNFNVVTAAVRVSPASTMTIDHNVFVGGDVGVEIQSNSATARLNITRNSFRRTIHSAVRSAWASGAGPLAVIEDNTFEDCGSYACLLLAESSRILNNTLTAQIGRPVQQFMTLTGVDVTYVVSDNSMIGVGSGPGSRYESYSYPAHRAISVMAGVVDLTRNHITNAGVGIEAVYATQTLTAIDNIVQTSIFPIAWNPIASPEGTLTANWNDFSDYMSGVANSQLARLNLRCNWWGQASGPTAMYPTVPTAVYTPFAVAPVAGQAHTGCIP